MAGGGLNFPKWLGFFIVTVDPFVLEIVKPPATVQEDILHLEVLTQSKEKHFFLGSSHRLKGKSVLLYEYSTGYLANTSTPNMYK